MAQPPKFIIRDKLYFRRDQVNLREVKRHYEKMMYDESACGRCKNLPDRHNEMCDACPAFQGEIKLWRKGQFKGADYIAIPVGDRVTAKKIGFDFHLAVDKRANPPFRNRLKFTRELYHGQTIDDIKTANQVKLTDEWLKVKHGIIEAAPRTGKTVLGCFISVQLGTRTLIVAHKKQLLRQFYRTYRDFTNMRALKARGRTVVKMVSTVEDLDTKADIVLVNYQKFISKYGPGRLKEAITGKFGLLIVDEAHMGSASAFAKFINEIDAKYRLGLTATPDRKDNRQFIGYALLGPVTVRSHTAALLPELEIIETGINPGEGKKINHWTYFLSFIGQNPDRTKSIVKDVFKDLREGHGGIIIPVEHRKQQNLLIATINNQARINNRKRGEEWPDQMAMAYNADSDQKKVLKDFEKGKHLVIVAISSMMKQGVDMKRPTMLYQVIPTSNGPMFYQLACRPCTPAKGKRQPKVKIYVDDMPQSLGCLRKLCWTAISPYLEGNKYGNQPRYKMSKENRTRMYALASSKPSRFGGKVVNHRKHQQEAHTRQVPKRF